MSIVVEAVSCCWVSIAIAALLILFVLYLLAKCCCGNSGKKLNGLENRLVVITGCDTGLGQMLAIALDKLGIPVVAGCITNEGVETLTKTASNKLKATLCNVTKDKDIEDLVSLVSSLPYPLWSIVNNAGICMDTPFDLATINNLEIIMDVNYYGTIRMIKGFLPLLKKNKGRIINVASLAGMLQRPCGLPYAGSKCAVKGMTQALRRELKPWGVDVIILEPSFMKTGILSNAEQQQRARFKQAPKELLELYDDEWIEEYMEKLPRKEYREAFDPKYAVEDMVHAITSVSPKSKYHSSTATKYAYVLWATMPISFWDSVFTYDPFWYPKKANQIYNQTNGSERK